MQGDEERGATQRESDPLGECRPGQSREPQEPVEAGRPAAVDAPRLLAHLDEAPGVRLGRREVQVRELGDGMADLLVHGPLGELAAVEMSHGEREGQRRHRGAQHLEAVAEHHEQVGTPAREGTGETGHADSRGGGDGPGGVRIEEHLDPLGDGPAIGLDGGDGAPEARREMAARHVDAELEVGHGLDFLEHGDEMAVVGAGDGDDADSPWHRPHSSPKCRLHVVSK